jgi:hypothetical protein
MSIAHYESQFAFVVRNIVDAPEIYFGPAANSGRKRRECFEYSLLVALRHVFNGYAQVIVLDNPEPPNQLGSIIENGSQEFSVNRSSIGKPETLALSPFHGVHQRERSATKTGTIKPTSPISVLVSNQREYRIFKIRQQCPAILPFGDRVTVVVHKFNSHMIYIDMKPSAFRTLLRNPANLATTVLIDNGSPKCPFDELALR